MVVSMSTIKGDLMHIINASLVIGDDGMEKVKSGNK